MAKYDPKRPRPTVGDEEAAPVDALIEAISVEPEADTEVVAAPSDPAPSDPAPSDSPHVSDVPVIPPPEEGTANRAVLAAVGGGLAIVIAFAIFLKLRRRRG